MDHEFEAVLRAVRAWSGAVPFPADVQRDDGTGLRIIWETETLLAELIVSRAEYAPYRFVSFQLLDIRLDVDQAPVYSYHDREDSTIDEILTALDRGVDLMKERREQHA